MAPGAWARPSLKAMQAALYLLHHRIRGAARTKKVWAAPSPPPCFASCRRLSRPRHLRPAPTCPYRPPNLREQELQHVYPVLEPAQAREFKAAMQEWVGELAAGGALAPDAAKYFVSAYQGSAAHRAVLLLLDLRCGALRGRGVGGRPESSRLALNAFRGLEPATCACTPVHPTSPRQRPGSLQGAGRQRRPAGLPAGCRPAAAGARRRGGAGAAAAAARSAGGRRSAAPAAGSPGCGGGGHAAPQAAGAAGGRPAGRRAGGLGARRRRAGAPRAAPLCRLAGAWACGWACGWAPEPTAGFSVADGL